MVITMPKLPQHRWLIWTCFILSLLTQNLVFSGDFVASAKLGHLAIDVPILVAAILLLKVAIFVPLVIYCVVNKSLVWFGLLDGLVICTVFLHVLNFVVVELPIVAALAFGWKV
jgi:hypothetical protein